MGGEEGLGITTGQPNLYKQDLSKLDVSKLTALSREVISRQATINIGTIGHVAHGKSTIVKAISGVQTVRFKNELERNITIKLDAVDCGSSSESADIPGRIDNETPVVYHKRHLSPVGSIDAPCAKQSRLREIDTESCNTISHRLNNRHTFHSASSSSKRLRTRRGITQQALEAHDGRPRLRNRNVRDPGSDGRQSDYEESSSDGRSSARDDSLISRDFDLKEVRVLLHDIKNNENNRELTIPGKSSSASSSQTSKLWEVERIIQKQEKDSETFYLIKWKNWDIKHNTWEPSRNLTNCEDLLREFENKRQKLINRFKAKTNFYPNTRDIEDFLVAQLLYKNTSIDDITSIASTTVADDSIYIEIRQYLNKPSRGSKLETKIKQQILYMLLLELRRDQLESLQDWENEMNSITKDKPTIRVENLVDLEGAPQDFYYIDSYLPGAGVIIPDDPPIGCECDNCETGKKSCCFAQNGVSSLPYTSARRVRVPPGTPIYECNKRCACDALTCPNRVVQRGSDTQLCIFRTNNDRGWGVRTLRAIKKGTFVIQYVGEVISNEEAERRGKQYDVTGLTYLFDLDYNETDGQCPYTVDAAMYGNISHFINHSCDPNLAVYAIWINCLDPNLPNLALFAIKDIKQNEELTFDYTCQTPRGGNEKMQQQPLDNEQDAGNISKNKTLCKCGAATCRRYLF